MGMRERTDQVGFERRAAISSGALEVVLELCVRVEYVRFLRRPCPREALQLWHMKLDMSIVNRPT